MPLPAITTCGIKEELFFFPLGRYEISTKRGPGLGEEFPTASNPPNSFNSLPAKTLIVNPLASEIFTASAANHCGFLIFEGVCTRSRANVMALEITPASSIISSSEVIIIALGISRVLSDF